MDHGAVTDTAHAAIFIVTEVEAFDLARGERIENW
jgi:hypothetical protein